MNYKVAAKIFGYFYTKYLWALGVLAPAFVVISIICFTTPMAIDYKFIIGSISLIIGFFIGTFYVTKVVKSIAAGYTNEIINQVPFRFRFTLNHFVSLILYINTIGLSTTTGMGIYDIITNEIIVHLTRIVFISIFVFTAIKIRISKMNK